MSAVIATAPGEAPIIGHAWQLRSRPLGFLREASAAGDIVTVRVGRRPLYLLTAPDLIRRQLVTQAQDFSNGIVLFDWLRLLLGNGVATSEGAFHRRQRRLLQPAFHASRHPAYLEIIRAATQARMERWRPGIALRVEHETAELALTAVTESLFSAGLTPDAVTEVRRTLPAVVRGIGRRSFTPVEMLYRLPTPGNRRFTAAVDRLHACVDKIIAEYRTAGADRGDLLSLLLGARHGDSGHAMTDQQVHDETITMLVTGTETVSSAMAWALHLLGAHPELADRVHAEADEVLGGKPVTTEDLPKLEYLGRVINETLRLFPPAWLIPRRAEADTVLGGHRLPAGTHLLFSPYALQRDPRYYTRPDVFDPDRWLPERSQSIPRTAYLPFGAGLRHCVGEGFARLELLVVLASVAARWRLRPVPDSRMRTVADGSLRPEQLWMTTEPR
ncbi:cytochrome P450 [Streptomyces formicae]|uniref:Cytochrome P450 n=1 Tax=Streptomyces formicae TaxID=1616117 RepID=A0ABY3WPR9_9ACTN|nr:cytochrome P450 [Streptomyces formicae]UNM11813.1 cytochrome P450 [Streptomyces formicae]